jgi:cyclopropane-fatty-acyl-phospholipid synthase
VEGDLTDGLDRFWELARRGALRVGKPKTADLLGAARVALRLGAPGPRPPARGAR